MFECIEVCCGHVEECTVDSHNLSRLGRINRLLTPATSAKPRKVVDLLLDIRQ